MSPFYRSQGTPIQNTTGYHFEGKIRQYKNNIQYLKIQTPLTDRDFYNGMTTGLFYHAKHKGLCALYYYSAVRCMEGLKATKEQFSLDTEGKNIIFNVGKRLKHGKETPPLYIPTDAPFACYIWLSVKYTAPGQRVWPYHRSTAYRIVNRAFKYPHLFRLSRITNFFNDGWSIAQVKNWTGLTLQALEFYVGTVDTKKMGASLKH